MRVRKFLWLFTPTWYWAFDPLAMDIFAFDTAGQVNALATDEIAETIYGWRTTPTQGFIVAENEMHDLLLHRLTANTIDSIALDDASEWQGVQTLDANAMASILINIMPQQTNRITSTPMIILNNETLDTLFVEQIAYRAALLADDGQHVYYARIDVDGDSQTITLAKTAIDTLETEDIFTFPEDTILVNVVQGHDYFYYRTRDNATRATAFYSIDVDGEPQLLGEHAPTDAVLDVITTVSYTANTYIQSDLLCGSGCTLRLYSLDNADQATAREFQVSQINGVLTPLRLYDADAEVARLLVFVDDQFVMLDSNGGEEVLGEFSPLTGLVLTQIISADGRYLFAIDNESETYKVWDLIEMRVIMENTLPNPNIFSVMFSPTEANFLVSEQLMRYILYRDGDVFNFPEILSMYYREILPNGDILASQASASHDMAKGVYYYDVDSDSFSLLVENALQIYLMQF